MGTKEDNQGAPTVPKSTPSPSPKEDANASQRSSSQPPHPHQNQNPNDTSPKKPIVHGHFFSSVAANYAAQPLRNHDPNVWGVLTAISDNARKRHQGINMLLTADEHCIGRLVEDTHFQIESNAVSANHCKIYRKNVVSEDADHSPNSCTSAFLKDMSTNGTYLNCERFKKNSCEVKIHHGDIISFSAPPQHDLAFTFVYREVLRSTPSMDGAAAKRKAEEYVSDNKRLKGIGLCSPDGHVSDNKRLKGIGLCSPDGPLSLDDFRSLQRSNTDLRRQLESQVLESDKLRNDNRTIVECHEKEMKEVKESVSKLYLDQFKALRDMLDSTQKELVDVSRMSAEQKHEMEDLNERLGASMLSCAEANEIMKSQKVSIDELKTHLDEERNLRRVDRENAEAELKVAVQKAQLEAEEKLKRLSEAASRRELEQQEVINKLQIIEKQSFSQVESLKLKLDETREKLVTSDNKIRQLEMQVCEEQNVSASGKKRIEELEHEIKRSSEELESEKAAREVAWAKVSALELHICAAMHDLDFERRRLKAARERIMLRETQLRAFYATTEEISVMFAKQQEQLKAMQKTLEDEENYENTSVDIDLNIPKGDNSITIVGEKQIIARHGNISVKADSNHEASTTEKHDCDIRSQEGQNTQDAEFSSADRTCKGGFGSEIDGVGTAPILEGDPIGTEQVHETESPGVDGERNINLKKSVTLAGETMQLEDEAHGHEIDERIRPTCQETANNSQLDSPPVSHKAMEDTIRTADLLASEVAGSWAISTAPSVHAENESPRSRDNDEEGTLGLHDSSVQAAESQSMPSSKAAPTKWSHDHQALIEMIGIVTPELKEQFGCAMDNDFHQGRGKQDSISSSDTEGCDNSDDNDGADAKYSGADTEGSEQADEDQKKDDAMDEDDEATQEDSLR